MSSSWDLMMLLVLTMRSACFLSRAITAWYGIAMGLSDVTSTWPRPQPWYSHGLFAGRTEDSGRHRLDVRKGKWAKVEEDSPPYLAGRGLMKSYNRSIAPAPINPTRLWTILLEEEHPLALLPGIACVGASNPWKCEAATRHSSVALLQWQRE